MKAVARSRRLGGRGLGARRRIRPEAPAKSRASATSRVMARMVIVPAIQTPAKAATTLLAERGEDEAGERPWPGLPGGRGEHGDDELGLVAPVGQEGGDEGGEEGVHRDRR